MLAAGTVMLYSCSGGGGMSAKAKKNKAANDSIMKAYEAGDFSKMGDYIAADAVDHGGEKGDIKGLDNIIAEMKRYRDMMPDMKYETKREMADDDYVITWATASGTMDGKQATVSSVDISKFVDGKAVEHWVYMDPREMMAMMPQGGMPGDNSTTPPGDTTKMK